MKGSHTLGSGRTGKKEHTRTHKTTEQGDLARVMAGALCEMARYRMDLHVAFIMNKLLIGSNLQTAENGTLLKCLLLCL